MQLRQPLFSIQQALIAPPIPIKERLTSPLIEVAIRTIKELALSTGLALVCCTFTTAPIVICGGMVTQLFINTVIRSFLAAKRLPQDTWGTSFVTALGSLHNPQILIHEIGHKLAADCLLQKSHSSSELFPYLGGATKFHVSRPTLIGTKLGLENIQPLIAAAGPLLTLSLSAIALGFASKLHNYSPELSKILIMASLTNFLYHSLYSLSAMSLSTKNLANDFLVLKIAGISPFLVSLTLLALPIIILWSQSYFETPLRLGYQS